MGDFVRNYWWLAIIVVAGMMFALLQMSPPPPKTITLSAGSPGGTYFDTAQAYADYLEEEGVTVEVLASAGTAENLERLRNGDADVALVQGGIVTEADKSAFQSLGAIFYEPFWLFHRSDNPVETYGDLRNQRLAIGPQGSGTRALALMLQVEWGGQWPPATALPQSGETAIADLIAGTVDAVGFVASIDSQYVRDLIANPDISLLNFETAAALARRRPFLGEVTVLQGVTNIGENLPEQDVELVAPTAQLAIRNDLHPALQSLLLEAAFDIHRDGTLLAPAGVFPNRTMIDLPLSSQAKRFFDNGPTFLRRIFSFEVANFLERAWVLLIPLATLAYPLFKAAPPIYRWRTRRKIYVWYQDLRELEARGRAATNAPDRELIRDHLRQLQAEVGRLEVPLSYTDDLYRLRNHIAFVNQLLGNLDKRQIIEMPGEVA